MEEVEGVERERNEEENEYNGSPKGREVRKDRGRGTEKWEEVERKVREGEY